MEDQDFSIVAVAISGTYSIYQALELWSKVDM